jgi:hypothetical protein
VLLAVVNGVAAGDDGTGGRGRTFWRAGGFPVRSGTVSGESELHPVRRALLIAFLSGILPVAAGAVRLLFVTGEGEGLATFAMVVIGAPASALIGLIAAALVLNRARSAPEPASPWTVWLLTTAAAFAVPLAVFASSCGSSEALGDRIGGLLPLLAGAAAGALPPALLALGLRQRAATRGDAVPRG